VYACRVYLKCFIFALFIAIRNYPIIIDVLYDDNDDDRHPHHVHLAHVFVKQVKI